MQDNKKWLYLMMSERVALSLKQKGYDVYIAENKEEAKKKALELIDENDKTIGVPGTMTIREIGVLDELKNSQKEIIEHWGKTLDAEERRKVYLDEINSDVFLLSANAITWHGEILNMDANGNRVAGAIFGPKKTIFVIGANKIVPDIQAGIWRIKNIATPMNARRLNLDLPCAKTGFCVDCKGAGRICKILTIFETKPGFNDIKVILVLEDLGY